MDQCKHGICKRNRIQFHKHCVWVLSDDPELLFPFPEREVCVTHVNTVLTMGKALFGKPAVVGNVNTLPGRPKLP